ncbi:MAG: class II aldolase/adducin family protein [Acidimicrobiaceae bacterium]|nr:class II aldolase/adducin family protein [Acidimicrobiaceae bacterium]
MSSRVQTRDRDSAEAELVARSCRILGKLDLTHAALGHVSVRLDGAESMLIKGKGPEEVGLRYTSVEDILEVDFRAEKVTGKDGLQPPSESFIHTWLYKKNPEVRAVIHFHPEHAVLLTICEREVFPIYGAFGAGSRLAIDGVPTFPRSITISDDELGDQFAEFMGAKKAVLMRGHGATVTGSSVEDATVRALALNELVTMMYKAYLLGDPKPIPSEDIAEMMKRRAEGGTRSRGSAGGAAGMLATWRYYRSLAGEDTA